MKTSPTMLISEWKWKLLMHVWLFAIPWTIAHQAPLSVEFSRQEYWGGLPFPFPGNLPDPGIKPRFPALQEYPLPFEPPEKSLFSSEINFKQIFLNIHAKNVLKDHFNNSVEFISVLVCITVSLKTKIHIWWKLRKHLMKFNQL